MALGIASGASPQKGLLTAIVAGFLVSALGGSRVQIGGPTGAFVVLVFNVIARHGYYGLVLATLLAGAILVVAGYARLGELIRFIPYTVVTGFTAGIAVIIASSQVGDFLGLRMVAVPADFLPKGGLFRRVADHQRGDVRDRHRRARDHNNLAADHAAGTGFLVAIFAASVIVIVAGLHVETIGSRFPGMPTSIAMLALLLWTLAKLQAVIPWSI